MTTEGEATQNDRNDHARCFVCGAQNPRSLGLSFTAGEKNSVTASFRGNPDLQGYRGILHGGIVAALLDAAMTHCLFHHGVRAVTGDLRIKFRHPIPCGSMLDLKAELLFERPPLYRVRSEIVCEGELMAWGEASFMRLGSRPEGVPGRGAGIGGRL